LTRHDGQVVPGHPIAYDQETGFGRVQALRPLGLLQSTSATRPKPTSEISVCLLTGSVNRSAQASSPLPMTTSSNSSGSARGTAFGFFKGCYYFSCSFNILAASISELHVPTCADDKICAKVPFELGDFAADAGQRSIRLYPTHVRKCAACRPSRLAVTLLALSRH
jgi:hypothetical protein